MVARELGLPTVVSVSGGLMKRLKVCRHFFLLLLLASTFSWVGGNFADNRTAMICDDIHFFPSVDGNEGSLGCWKGTVL